MKYALIAPDGHSIMQVGDAPEDMIAMQGGDLLSLPAPEEVEDDTHYWDGEAFRLYPPRPGPWAVWDGTAWIDPRSEADHAADLEAARAAARRAVNHARGQARLRYITDEPGQAMVYLDKEAQAMAWLADPDPDPAHYPAIRAEVGSTALTAHEVAQVYVTQAAIWRQVSAAIEHVVMAAHAILDTAAGIEACETIAAGIAGQIDAALIAAGAAP